MITVEFSITTMTGSVETTSITGNNMRSAFNQLASRMKLDGGVLILDEKSGMGNFIPTPSIQYIELMDKGEV